MKIKGLILEGLQDKNIRPECFLTALGSEEVYFKSRNYQ